MTLIHGDASVAIVVVETVFSFAAVAAIGLRLWARRLTKKQLCLNDWAAVAALFFNMCLGGTVYYAVIEGMGQHAKDLENPEAQVAQVTKSLLALETLWAVANSFVKISILHLYIQIFRGKWFVRSAYTVMLLGISYSIAVLMEAMVLCRPIAYTWDKNIDGTCGNATKAYEAVGILNLFTDLAIIILPMPLLWRLQLPLAKKVALTAIFGIGIVICVISTIRIIGLAAWDPSDLTWTIRRVACWSILECTLGIINCCLPVLGPVASRCSNYKLWTWHQKFGKSTFSKGSTFGKKLYGQAGLQRSNDIEAAPFKRLPEHVYPLDDLSAAANNTVSHSEDPGYETPYSGQGLHVLSDIPSSQNNTITVKSEWEVKHV